MNHARCVFGRTAAPLPHPVGVNNGCDWTLLPGLRPGLVNTTPLGSAGAGGESSYVAAGAPARRRLRASPRAARRASSTLAARRLWRRMSFFVARKAIMPGGRFTMHSGAMFNCLLANCRRPRERLYLNETMQLPRYALLQSPTNSSLCTRHLQIASRVQNAMGNARILE